MKHFIQQTITLCAFQYNLHLLLAEESTEHLFNVPRCPNSYKLDATIACSKPANLGPNLFLSYTLTTPPSSSPTTPQQSSLVSLHTTGQARGQVSLAWSITPTAGQGLAGRVLWRGKARVLWRGKARGALRRRRRITADLRETLRSGHLKRERERDKEVNKTTRYTCMHLLNHY